MTTRRLFDRVARALSLPDDPAARAELLLSVEWLVTNGIGGYASCTTAGLITRRYHGILVAALPNPLGRTVMLNHLGERLVRGSRSVPLNIEKRVAGPVDPEAAASVSAVRLEGGLPVWDYEWDGMHVEKRILMPYRQNTVHVTYRLVAGPDIAKLELNPTIHFRGYEDRVNTPRNAPSVSRYEMRSENGMYWVTAESPDDLPWLRLYVSKADGRAANCAFVSDERVTSEFLYPVEQSRGYEFRGTLWSPGRYEVELCRGEEVTLVASVESEEVMRALSPEGATRLERERRRRLVDAASTNDKDDTQAGLVVAADQFIITPKGRVTDATRANALGNEVRTVIAGYHWFTDWGRDTMISLEGLTLTTGRVREASFILRTFADYVRQGLIPNMFPDGSNKGLYHTADASLWFFHAVEAYVRRTGDQDTLVQLLPVMTNIIRHHITGTAFGIGMDATDGLLRQGAEGYQLTWMDAKVDGWVVTPRRGKAVEINALWYNALRLLENWVKTIRGEGDSEQYKLYAERVYESFNKRFWIGDDVGYLYDVIDGEGGDSPLCRPNQLFAISLPHPVLERQHWEPVMRVVQERLLTPFGLRSLAPGEPDYKPRYFGDLRARDAAYHQGTVWAWLIGPWVDAWLKLHPDDRAGARDFLEGCVNAMDDYGLGTIAEIFDAEPPYTPRGCIAQAWSVAEVLRCWVKTAPPNQPPIESRS
jgi:predicted glycogen debranching enzyme